MYTSSILLLYTIIQRDETYLTAHHADDKLETMLFRMFRGTGITGLVTFGRTSTLNVDGVSIAIERPLIACTKVVIRDYAKAQRLVYCEDRTNEDTSITRNFIRRDVIPIISSRFPMVNNSFAKLATRLEEAETIMQEVYAGEWGQYVKSFTATTVTVKQEAVTTGSMARKRNFIYRLVMQMLNVYLQESQINEIIAQLLVQRRVHSFMCAGLSFTKRDKEFTVSFNPKELT